MLNVFFLFLVKCLNCNGNVRISRYVKSCQLAAGNCDIVNQVASVRVFFGDAHLNRN